MRQQSGFIGRQLADDVKLAAGVRQIEDQLPIALRSCFSVPLVLVLDSFNAGEAQARQAVRKRKIKMARNAIKGIRCGKLDILSRKRPVSAQIMKAVEAGSRGLPFSVGVQETATPTEAGNSTLKLPLWRIGT